MPFSLSQGCGLDWTLPQAHFEGVDEQGYVAYWEKIGQADLGDGLIIPVHINFNSHRETSSPTLGKGWMLPLLESHVEPVDENTVHVIMPDGWTFVFYRNGNTDTWRGNAGWVGETDGPRFTATAPCGWRVKFDTGKILEIDTPKNRTISIKYNGPAPLEADIDSQPFVQVAQNTTTGAAESITIANQKIAISQAPRPRIQVILGKTLLTGFDPALSQLQWPSGNKETFDFAAPPSLAPTLAITKEGTLVRNITWDPSSSQIVTDGAWKYDLLSSTLLTITRTRTNGEMESYSYDANTGTTTEQDVKGIKLISSTFVNAGPLTGKIRSVIRVENGVSTVIRHCDYDESGKIVREFVLMSRPHIITYKYNSQGKESEMDMDGRTYMTEQYDDGGRLMARTLWGGTQQVFTYLESQIKETTFFRNGKTRVRMLDSMFRPTKALLETTTQQLHPQRGQNGKAIQ